MLCQFTFKNFKSYRDETTLDLCPAGITEHPGHLISCKEAGENFLPVAVIYGPNGGGKTCVIDAFVNCRFLILNSLKKGNKSNIKKERNNDNITFLFDNESTQKPTEWCVSFITNGYEYKYTISQTNEKVINENLYAKALITQEIQMLFERDNGIITTGEYLKDIPINNLSDGLPLLSFLAILYKFDHISNIIEWFNNINTLDYGAGLSGNRIAIPAEMGKREVFYKLLRTMGINIDQINIKRDSKGNIINVYLVYNYNGNKYQLDYEDESEGTKKILSLLTVILISLDEGVPLFIDELDAKLHPKLLEYIISFYTDSSSNKNGAQLIFTSHDLYTLDSQFLRRDEIYFAAKREDFSSYLYSLSDFKKEGKKPRKDEKYAKQYMEGRYGADPYFQRIKTWGDGIE